METFKDDESLVSATEKEESDLDESLEFESDSGGNRSKLEPDIKTKSKFTLVKAEALC